MTTSSVVASDLVVTKQKNRILDKLSFEIVPGSITGLIGPSGSGKTTLMRTIVGVQKYDGDLSVLGKDAGHRTLRRKIGYVTQSPAVYPDLTVEQNLQYFGALAGAKKKVVDRVISHVRLEKQKKQVVESLSGGQKARVSLAVALLGDPEIFVLDEPTVGLDPILRNELWELFADMADDGKTLLISSHVMDEAERCDNLMLLRDGKLLWNDTRKGLLQHTDQRDVGSAFITMIEKEAK
jgi:ABC-2 type transport system ATP-binding protein